LAVNRDIPGILQRSIVRQHIYKVTKNRWSTAENARTTEGQTCGIARYTRLIVRGTMFASPYLRTLTSELQNFAVGFVTIAIIVVIVIVVRRHRNRHRHSHSHCHRGRHRRHRRGFRCHRAT